MLERALKFTKLPTEVVTYIPAWSQISKGIKNSQLRQESM